jgi:cytochrome P450
LGDAAVSVPTHAGFDHSTDPQLLADHYAEWTRLQAEQRAFRSEVAGEYDLWYLLQHDDINEAFKDTELFSSRTVQYLGETMQTLLPEELDPPEHGKYRRILNPSLSPDAVAKLEPEIRERCVGLIEEVADAGQCDFVRDIALRFPTAIFLQLMGLPVDHVDELVALARTILHTTAEHDPDFSIRATAAFEIVGHLTAAFEARRAQPADDLVSALLAGSVDGRPLTDDELVGMGFLLYLAGLDTVANVLSYSIRHLAGDDALRASLSSDPERWPTAVEEFLRFYSIATTARVVTRDAEFAGCPMRAGDRVVLPTAAASRDPHVFDHADTFDPDRPANRHMAFGAGPHRCVGAHLARLELRVAMEEWHRRIPDYAVAPGAVIHEAVGAVAGMDSLPLTWTP